MEPFRKRAATVIRAAAPSSTRRAPVRRPSTCRGRSRARSSARPAAPNRNPAPRPSIRRPVSPPPSSSGCTRQTTTQPTPTAARVPMMKHSPPMVGRPRGSEGWRSGCCRPGLRSASFSGVQGSAAADQQIPDRGRQRKSQYRRHDQGKTYHDLYLRSVGFQSPLSVSALAAASCNAHSLSMACSSAIPRLPLKRIASPGPAALASRPAISS